MAKRRSTMRVLFTCIGRRVELVQAFRAAGEKLGIDLELWGGDHSRSAPAMSFVDKQRLLPSVDSQDYINKLIDTVKRSKIDAVIPLIDHELLALATARERFAEHGCNVVISDYEPVSLCRDKVKTHQHLVAAGVDTPRTWSLTEVRAMKKPRYPFFVKPRSGSAGAGLHVIDNDTDLAQAERRVREPIVQEYLSGVEYTLDVYVGLDGQPACIVSRRRLRVRGGEVSESQVDIRQDVIAVARRAVQSFKGLRGVVTVQCIREVSGRIAVIEINPRFGGGIPLSIAAGADMPRYLLADLLGRKQKIPPTARRNGLMMIRYDQSVFSRAPIVD